MLEEYNFTLVALQGQLCISVTYHSMLSDFNLDFSTSLPQKIIPDYVGSSNTDSLRSFPSSEKGVCATFFPLRGPVTILLPVVAKSSRNLSSNLSDPSRNYLPPLSPISTKNDASSQESPSGIRSFRKIEASRIGGVHPGMENDAGQRIVKDNKDGGDFSCPSDIDDVDTPVQISQNVSGKSSSEITSTSLPMGKKSQGAAVGVLVHMLRTAPPLRQDPSCYSTHSLKTELEGGVASASGFFIPRRQLIHLKS